MKKIEVKKHKYEGSALIGYLYLSLTIVILSFFFI